MTKKTIEEFKEELEDKIKSIVRKRNELLMELDKLQKEIAILLEQSFSLDESKIKIKCLNCSGVGYKLTDDGKKQMCPSCGGPDNPYIWAEKYFEIIKKSSEETKE